MSRVVCKRNLIELAPHTLQRQSSFTGQTHNAVLVSATNAPLVDEKLTGTV
jgi:hypothetical protein